MSFVYSQSNQYIPFTNTDIINVATPYLSNVKAGDLLLLFWGMADDDIITLDDAGWTEKTECNPLQTVLEVRMYYKYATSDNEQVTTYTLASPQNRFICTRLIKGAHATIPFVDAQNWSSSSGSNTLVRFPAMTATANNQLCIYMGMSDGDNIVDGSHGVRKIASDEDYRVYEQVVNSGAVAQFDDSIDSDQACTFGVIINDAANSPLPLVISPTKSLTKLTPDSRNDTGWREKIYDSGYDILTGETRVGFTADLTVYHATNQWAIRLDNLSDETLIQVGETMTIGSATGTVADFQASSFSSRGYVFVTSWSGGDPSDNAAVTFGTSGVTGLVWGSASYHHDMTGYFRSSIDLTMFDYTTMKFTGAASIGIADGVHFIIDHSMDSESEGYWFKTRADDRAYYESSDFIPIAASPTGVTISPYGMVNNTLTYVEGTKNRYDNNNVTSIKGWDTNISGTASSYITPQDWSNKKIGLWNSLYNNSIKYAYFLLIDDNGEWKLWRTDSYYRDEYNGNEVKHYMVDPNSIDTPLRTSGGTFDVTNIKYYACLYQQTSASARYPLDIYDQYEIAIQTVTGGNDNTRVGLRHITEMINSETTLSGHIYNETLFSKIPSQYILCRSIKLSCAIDMQNQSLTFPLQTDHNQEFWWNVDAYGVEIETDNSSGIMLNCLMGSDKGALLTNTANDTIDTSGTIYVKYTHSLLSGKTYTNNSFVECGQIDGNGSTLDGCTIDNSSDETGAYLLVSGSDIVKNSTIKNNTIGILVEGSTDFTLDGNIFNDNTTDLHFSATTGAITVTIANGSTPTYTTAGIVVTFDAPSISGLVSGILNGSRIRVYNETTTTEITNEVVSGTVWELDYLEGGDFTIGDIVSIYITKIEQLELKIGAVAGASGWSVLASQVVDTIYNDNAINGSTVTEFSANYTTDRLQVTDGDGTTSVQRIYAWWKYNLTTALGIENWTETLFAEDSVNYRFNASVTDIHITNMNAAACVIIGARLYRDDFASVLDQTSGSLQLDPYKAYTASDIINQISHIPKFSGVIWYVSTSGNDASNGRDPETPFLTIANAITSASNGDMINIMAGTYPENIDISKDGLEINGESGAEITGTGTCVTVSGGACKVSNLVIKPSAGQTGFLVTGPDGRYENIRIPMGAIGLQTNSTATHSRFINVRVGKNTTYGISVGAKHCQFIDCMINGSNVVPTGLYIRDAIVDQCSFVHLMTWGCTGFDISIVSGADENIFTHCAYETKNDLGTDNIFTDDNVNDIKAKTDLLNFTGSDVQATIGSAVVAIDTPTVVDAVWDEALSGHSTSGTTGEKLNKVAKKSDVDELQ